MSNATRSIAERDPSIVQRDPASSNQQADRRTNHGDHCKDDPNSGRERRSAGDGCAHGGTIAGWTGAGE
jgi:hypothetical protein